MSSTVTVEVQVLELPFTSVTVRVTVLEPTLEQVKLFGATVMVETAQLSEEPLSISLPVMLAEPEALSCTVMF